MQFGVGVCLRFLYLRIACGALVSSLVVACVGRGGPDFVDFRCIWCTFGSLFPSVGKWYAFFLRHL